MYFSIFLHGRGLLLHDELGNLSEGGVYTWRAVEAENQEAAIEIAKRSLLTNENLVEDVWNESLDEIEIHVEEIHQGDYLEEASDSGLVYYIESDEEE